MTLLRRLLPGIALVAGTFLLSVGLQTLAFTEPSAGPTGGTVYAPVNTSGISQTKLGAFTASDLYVSDGVQIQGLSGRNYFRDLEGAGLLRVGAAWGMPGIYAESGVGVVGGSSGVSLQNNALFVTPAYNVGIGTTNPSQRLDVAGNVNVTGCFMVNGTCISSGGGGLSGGSTNYIPKWTSGTTLSGSSSIYDNGNVGIGTASPSEKLHVNGNLYVGGYFYKSGNLATVNNALSNWSVEGGMSVGFNNGFSVTMGKTTVGDAGIGVRNGSTAVAGFGYSAGSAVTDVTSFGGTTNGISLSSATFRALNVINNGNVGIGTTWPSEKLEVVGNVKVGRMLVADTQYGYRSGPGIGTDGSGVGVQANYFNVGSMSGTAYAPVYASDYWINNAGRWASSPSDIRLKKDIQPLTNVLDKLLNVRGVSFNWNDAYAAFGHPNDERQIGVIAQELETQFPELVTASSTDGYKRLNYEGLTAVLVEAVKEQQKEIDSLRARIDALEKK